VAIRVDRSDRVAIVSLDRPDKHNALTTAMLSGIGDAVARLNNDDDVGCIVLAGEGPSFCAGFDLYESHEQDESDLWSHWLALQDNQSVLRSIWESPKPTVCETKGYCLGAGLGLMSQCDLVVAADNTVFCEPELKFSFLPQPHFLYLLPFRVAAEVMLLGRNFDAAEAKSFGLVNMVTSTDDLRSTTMRTATTLASRPPEIVRMTKRLMKATLDTMGRGVMAQWGWDAFLLSKVMPTKQRAAFDQIVREKGLKDALSYIGGRDEAETRKDPIMPGQT
jgi:enoyl-CoA hydratase/carnithine racemase